MKNLIISAITIIFVFSCTAPSKLQNTNILNEDLTGKLSQNKLNAIAKLIKEVEQNPSDSGVKQSNLILFKWLAGSPDISVTLYPILTNAKNLNDDSRGTLLMQLMFSTAAAIIEDPKLKKDKAKATFTGLTRTLSVYKILKRENGVSDPYLDNLVKENDNNNLLSIVTEIVNNTDKK